MNRGHWKSREQEQVIGSAMAIATTARLLSELRRTEIGRRYIDFLVNQERLDKVLCTEGAKYVPLSMLPFAVELCLKALKAQGGAQFIRTHNLKCLWEDLKEDQEKIQQRLNDPAWREEERRLREAHAITGTPRTVDDVIETHQDDFEKWRYVPDAVKNLTEEKKSTIIDEAFIDLFGLVNACVGYHKERRTHHASTTSAGC